MSEALSARARGITLLVGAAVVVGSTGLAAAYGEPEVASYQDCSAWVGSVATPDDEPCTGAGRTIRWRDSTSHPLAPRPIVVDPAAGLPD